MKQIFRKSFLLTFLITILMFAAPQTASASKIGDVTDYVLYTDIVTYIDKQPIQSYNINGYTAVVVEDLAYYGFDVVWDASSRILYARRLIPIETAKKPTYKNSNISKSMVGKRAAAVLYTDVKCYFNGKQLKSYNIGGKTIIYVDDLAEMYAESYAWNPDERTLNLDLVKPWETYVTNPKCDVTVDKIPDGFDLSFENSSTDEKTDFIITDYFKDYAVIDGVYLSDAGLNFNIYQRVLVFGDFIDSLRKASNVVYGERVEENTAERKKELFTVFRMYINDELVNGELEYSQGNGRLIYEFKFDKRISLTEIKTMRVEVGFQ